MAQAPDDIGQILGLINGGEWRQAIIRLRYSVTADPADHRAWFLMGEAFLQGGDGAGAEGPLGRALAMLPSRTAEISYRLGVARLLCARLEAAEQAFDQAIAGMPDRVAQWLSAGDLALERNYFSLAEKLFRQATQAAPDMLPAWMRLLDCLFRQERGDDGLEAMAAILRLDPERLDIAERLVQTAVFTDQPALAESVARETAARMPDSVRAIVLVGWLLRVLRRFAESVPWFKRAAAIAPGSGDLMGHLGAVLRQAGLEEEAQSVLSQALRLDPNAIDATLSLAEMHLDHGRFQAASDLLDSYDQRVGFPQPARRSVIIPVLDYSPGSPYNIVTLLDDLKDFVGEVICVFNGDAVFADLRDHPRIDKWSYNKVNAGVGRGWNIGINLAEGETLHILNADLKISVAMLDRLEYWLSVLPDALCVGASGHWMNYDTLTEVNSLPTGSFTTPIVADKVSGQLFSLHAGRLHDCGITFDPRLSPYFGEESDLAFKARQNGLKIYAVPETDFYHAWGISKRDRPIQYMGRPVHRLRHMTRNRILLERKWALIKRGLRDS